MLWESLWFYFFHVFSQSIITPLASFLKFYYNDIVKTNLVWTSKRLWFMGQFWRSPGVINCLFWRPSMSPISIGLWLFSCYHTDWAKSKMFTLWPFRSLCTPVLGYRGCVFWGCESKQRKSSLVGLELEGQRRPCKSKNHERETDKMFQSPAEVTFITYSFSSGAKTQCCEHVRWMCFTTEIPGMGFELRENTSPSWQAGRQSTVQVQAACRRGLGQ